jgi:hypothetical protein
MSTNNIVVTWHDGQQKWVATSQSPRGKAMAESPTIAVNRLKRSLAQRDERARFKVTVELPSGARTAIDRYFSAMAESADRQQKALSMQVELAELFIERYGLNRTQAAVAVGLSQSHLGKILDGKVLRSVSLPKTVDPAESIAEFVNTPVAERQSIKRNDKKR